jgi:Chromate transporter
VAAMSNGEAPSATISNGNGATTTNGSTTTTTNGNSSVISANVASAVANGPDAPPNNTTAKEKMTAKAVDLDDEIDASVALQYGWRTGVIIIAVWLLLFVGAVLLRNYADGRAWQVLGVFFYVGTIVFGGGPVVIPLLFQYIVEPGWAEPSAFLLGLAIINSMPGTLRFTMLCYTSQIYIVLCCI